MANLLLNLLGKAASQQLPMEQVLGTIRAANDPIGEMTRMASSDPRMQEVINVINQNGGLKQAVIATAKEKGLDLDQVLKEAQQQMLKMFNNG